MTLDGGSMTDEERLRDLIGGLYETAADIRLLPRVLKALADELGAASGVLFVVDSETGAFNSWSSSPIDRKLMQALHEDFHLIDFIKKVSADTPKGSILTRPAFLSDREYGKCALFQEVLSHVNVWHVMGEVVMRTAKSVALIGFIRPRRSKAFSDDKIETYRCLSPHIERALRLHRLVARLDVQRNEAAEVLDRLPLGVILVDAGGRVISMNRSASDIAKRADGLQVDGGGICRAEGAKERARLADMIARAANSEPGPSAQKAGAMRIPRPSQLRPLSILVAPLTGKGPRQGRRGSAVLYVRDPESPHTTSAAVLADAYGLTASEAKLLQALIQGKRLEDMARDFKVTINTLRTHLKSIFRKTGTKRQSELLSLVLSGPTTHAARESC
jgi:DNA-binding CsgD family transcriptional regulator